MAGVKKKNRPAPLAEAAEAAAPVHSYRIENEKTFVHGGLQINESGIKVAAGGAPGSTGAVGSATPSVNVKDPYSSLSKNKSVGGSGGGDGSIRDAKSIAAAPVAAAAASASYTNKPSTTAASSGASTASGGGSSVDAKYAVKLEHLQMMEKLGEGNSSSVYRAMHVPTKRMMAVKMITIHDRDKRHQIMKEVTTLYECDNKYLIKFHGAFFKDDAIYVVLDLMDAGSLLDILNAVKYYPEPVLACVAYQVCSGFIYLTGRKQVHRDIKPANICVNSSGEVRITDFGIAAQLADTMVKCKTFIGTHLYMSPERLEGKEYGYSSDIWALGVTLYECATGQNPFLPKTVDFIEMFQNVVHGKLPDTSAFSADFQSFISLCLQKDPAQRATAKELLQHAFITRNQSFGKKEMSAWLKDKLKLKSAPASGTASGTATPKSNGSGPATATSTPPNPLATTAVAASADGKSSTPAATTTTATPSSQPARTGGIAGLLGKGKNNK